jgi:hypothetical protein
MPKIEHIGNTGSDNPNTNKSEVSQTNPSALNGTVYQSDPTQLKGTVREEHFPFQSNPSTVITLSSAGTIVGPLTVGDYFLYTEVSCYFKQGSSGLTVSQITADRTTPSTSNPLGADIYFPIRVASTDNNYIGFKVATTSPTGILYIIKKL